MYVYTFLLKEKYENHIIDQMKDLDTFEKEYGSITLHKVIEYTCPFIMMQLDDAPFSNNSWSIRKASIFSVFKVMLLPQYKTIVICAHDNNKDLKEAKHHLGNDFLYTIFEKSRVLFSTFDSKLLGGSKYDIIMSIKPACYDSSNDFAVYEFLLKALEHLNINGSYSAVYQLSSSRLIHQLVYILKNLFKNVYFIKTPYECMPTIFSYFNIIASEFKGIDNATLTLLKKTVTDSVDKKDGSHVCTSFFREDKYSTASKEVCDFYTEMRVRQSRYLFRILKGGRLVVGHEPTSSASKTTYSQQLAVQIDQLREKQILLKDRLNRDIVEFIDSVRHKSF